MHELAKAIMNVALPLQKSVDFSKTEYAKDKNLGSTTSGKTIHRPDTNMYSHGMSAANSTYSKTKNATQAKAAMDHHVQTQHAKLNYTAQDHRDAAQEHERQAYNHGVKSPVGQAHKTIADSHNRVANSMSSASSSSSHSIAKAITKQKAHVQRSKSGKMSMHRESKAYVIGQTRSGKHIYSNAKHYEHSNFTAADHVDAMNAGAARSRRINDKWRGYGYEHEQAARAKGHVDPVTSANALVGYGKHADVPKDHDVQAYINRIRGNGE